MKNLIIAFIAFVAFSTYASTAAIPVQCRVNLRYGGIFYVQCPRTMVAQGTDIWISPGPYPNAQVRVQCAIPEIVCNDLTKKDLQNKTN